MITSHVAHLVRNSAVRRTVFRLYCSVARCENEQDTTKKNSSVVNDVTSTMYLTENAFSHKIMRDLDRYKLRFIDDIHGSIKVDSSDMKCDHIEWDALSNDQLCQNFAKVSLEAVRNGEIMSDDKYVKMFSTLCDRVPRMTVLDLKNVLASLLLWRSNCTKYQPEFHMLWRAVDKALVDRINRLTLDSMFEFMELLYQLQLGRNSDYFFMAIKKIGRSVRKLSSEQLVLFLFYMNALRTVGKTVDFLQVEEKLVRVLDKLTIEELGIACAGFFKTETHLHIHNLIDAIISKLIKNANTVPEISLVCIIKALRYKLPTKLWHRLPEMIDALYPQIDRLSMKAAIHIPLILTASLTLREDVMDKISNKLLNEIDDVRLKDMEKVVYPLALLNYNPKTPKCIFTVVSDQLDRAARYQELIDHPKCYIAILHYLVHRNIFLHEHIDRILSMEFLRTTYGRTNFMIGREALFIDTSVELECQSYNGNRLPTEVRNYLSKRYSFYVPDRDKTKVTYHEKYELDVADCLRKVSGDRCTVKYLLPNHPRADYVVRCDANGDFLPLAEDLINIEPFTGVIRSPGPDYVAILPLSRNMLLKNLENTVMGEYAVKIRQLKSLGYQTLMVFQNCWPADATEAHKEDYLRGLIRTLQK